MSRQRAWILAAIASASLVALVIGVGATTGQFGFGGGQQGAQAEGASPTSETQPLRANLIVDTQQQPDNSESDGSHDDDRYEHERGDHHDDHEGDSEDSEDGD